MKTAVGPKLKLLWGEEESEAPSRRKMSTEGKRWYKKIKAEYQIGDEAGLLILGAAVEAFDRMREAQAILASEGLTVRDRFGVVKAHPLCTVERDSRAAMLAALKQLNLDLEPLRDGPGRPGGRR